MHQGPAATPRRDTPLRTRPSTRASCTARRGSGGRQPAPLPAGAAPGLLLLAPDNGGWVLAPARTDRATAPAALRALAASLSAEYPVQGDALPSVISVPDARLAGHPAILHHGPARTALYCPATHLADPAAEALTALAAEAALAGLSRTGEGPPAGPVPMAVHPVPCDVLPGPCHPALALPGEDRISLCVCEGLITASLAAGITEVWARHAVLVGQHWLPGS